MPCRGAWSIQPTNKPMSTGPGVTGYSIIANRNRAQPYSVAQKRARRSTPLAMISSLVA